MFRDIIDAFTNTFLALMPGAALVAGMIAAADDRSGAMLLSFGILTATAFLAIRRFSRY